MAQSPAHKLGQIIGDELERAIHKPLREIAEEFGLYLDYKHPRTARGGKSKKQFLIFSSLFIRILHCR